MQIILPRTNAKPKMSSLNVVNKYLYWKTDSDDSEIYAHSTNPTNMTKTCSVVHDIIRRATMSANKRTTTSTASITKRSTQTTVNPKLNRMHKCQNMPELRLIVFVLIIIVAPICILLVATVQLKVFLVWCGHPLRCGTCANVNGIFYKVAYINALDSSGQSCVLGQLKNIVAYIPAHLEIKYDIGVIVMNVSGRGSGLIFDTLRYLMYVCILRIHKSIL